jgi:hypothetical protein
MSVIKYLRCKCEQKTILFLQNRVVSKTKFFFCKKKGLNISIFLGMPILSSALEDIKEKERKIGDSHRCTQGGRWGRRECKYSTPLRQISKHLIKQQ